MTEPSNPDEARDDVADVDQTAPVPPTEAPAAPPAAPTAGAAPPYAGPYAAQPMPYPFAPVVKEPWFNPRKRTSVLVAAIIGALVLFGVGFVAGAATDHHDRGGRVIRMGPAGNNGYGWMPMRNGNGKLRLRPGGNLVPPGASGAPSIPSLPTPSHT